MQGPWWITLGHAWSEVEAACDARRPTEVAPGGCDCVVAPGKQKAGSGDLQWSPSTCGGLLQPH